MVEQAYLPFRDYRCVCAGLSSLRKAYTVLGGPVMGRNEGSIPPRGNKCRRWHTLPHRAEHQDHGNPCTPRESCLQNRVVQRLIGIEHGGGWVRRCAIRRNDPSVSDRPVPPSKTSRLLGAKEKRIPKPPASGGISYGIEMVREKLSSTRIQDQI